MNDSQIEANSNTLDTNSGSSGLIRQLSWLDAAAIIIGTIIGSGIFIVPGMVARNISSPGLILITWVLGGVLCLLGAFIFAELASSMPATGGIYVFLKEAFGPLVSFIFGWLFLLVIKPGAIAAITTGVAEYVSQLVPLSAWGIKATAIILILLLSIIHYRGVRLGSNIMNFLTSLKILLIAGFIVLGFTSSRADWSLLTSGTGSGFSLGVLSAMGIALAAILWTYDGWADICYMAGEVKDPGRSLPKAILLSTAAVIGIYVAMNIIFLITVPLEQMAASDHVAADSARRLLGDSGAALVTVAIIISITGGANGSVMLGPRVFYRMGADGYFFRWTGRVHPRFRTPANAVVVQGLWAAVLATSGTFDQLINYFIFTTWLFFALSTVTLFIFRRRDPTAERPYSTPGYPWTPIVFLILAAAMLINSLFQRPLESGIGLGFAALGFPVYFFLFKRRQTMQHDSVETDELA